MATLFQSVPDLYFTPPNSDFIDDVAGNQQMFDTFTLTGKSLVTSIAFDVDNQAIFFPNWQSEPLTLAIYTIGPSGGPGTELFSTTFTPADDPQNINLNLSFATALVTYDTDLVLNPGTYLITYYNQDGLGAMGFVSGGSDHAFAEHLSTGTISPVDESLGFSLSGEAIPPGETYIAGTPGEPLTSGNASVFLDGSLLQNQTITAGNGNDTALAGSNDTISLGNGTDVVNAGDSDTIRLGNGPDAVTAGANSVITLGNGNDDVTTGSNSTVKVGNGTDTVTAGANSTIAIGNGADTVTAGENSTIKVGNGNDTIDVGNSDTVTVGHGQDSFVFEQTTPSTIGAVTVTGFDPSKDSFTFSNQLTTAVTYQDNAHGNAVITVDPAGDTITLLGVHSSALHPSDFQFVDPAAAPAHVDPAIAHAHDFLVG
jgi:hypothetical protein